MDVLVDTSVWSLALRRHAESISGPERALRAELVELIREGRVAIVGPVRQEVLSGIRDEAVFERLREQLRAFDDEALSEDDYEEAARIGNRCRSVGVAGSAVDFLVCAAAERRGLAVFTSDADFERYSRVVPLTLHHAR